MIQKTTFTSLMSVILFTSSALATDRTIEAVQVSTHHLAGNIFDTGTGFFGDVSVRFKNNLENLGYLRSDNFSPYSKRQQNPVYFDNNNCIISADGVVNPNRIIEKNDFYRVAKIFLLRNTVFIGLYNLYALPSSLTVECEISDVTLDTSFTVVEELLDSVIEFRYP